ncbi:MAG: HD domain-containing protein [Thermoleophilia bacterium]|nr:HD domain-containing protein [Thermoleophilia bacterium]
MALSRLGPRFEEALTFAARVHRGQLRKVTTVPYAAHLLAVAALVLEDGGSEEKTIAALLDDAPEDQGGLGRLADIEARFGAPVAEIVAGCSDTFETPKPEWERRKRQYLGRLETEPEAVLRVSLADKLHNARAILRDYEADGDAVFEKFNASKDKRLWFYGEMAEIFAERLPGWMAQELAAVVGKLEGSAP